MARNSGARRIRIMQDGLIDEEGQRWDRIRSGNYYLTPADVASLSHVFSLLHDWQLRDPRR